MPLMLKARLHPLANGHYSVLFDGKLIAENSRDPECDAARALVKLGYTGVLAYAERQDGQAPNHHRH